MEKQSERKKYLIKLMLEAKKIEIISNKQNIVFQIKSIFSKPKKSWKERINALEKNLEKKDVEDLEYMILQKEGSILLLEKRVSQPKEKNTLKKLINEMNEMKKREGKRAKIARELGFKKKEIKLLEKQIEGKGIETEKKKKTGIEKKAESKALAPKKEKIIKKKGKKKKLKKSARGKQKTKKTTKKAGKKKIQKPKSASILPEKKTGITFTSPLEELKKKREEEVNAKRKKALETFHQEFTSGKDTYISIKGDAQIIAGKQPGRAAGTQKSITAGTRAMQAKTNEQLDFDASKVKEKIKNLKSAFFHRQISESDYKKKLFDYQEELSSLEMEKKRPKANYTSTEEQAPAYAGKRKRRKHIITGDSGLKTIQEESIQFATQHTPKSRQKVKKALNEFSQTFSSKPFFEKQENSIEPEAIQKTEVIRDTGIIKRIAPKANNKRIMEMENKLGRLMQKRNIGEKEVRKELEFVSASELTKKFDKILSVIEQKYRKEETTAKIVEDYAFDGTVVAPQKKVGKIDGKLKEIKEKKIVTDFDRLLKLVKEKGKVNEKEARQILKMSSKRIKECYTVLEKNDLVKLDFPMFGGAQIISKGYAAPKKKKKEKKRVVK